MAETDINIAYQVDEMLTKHKCFGDRHHVNFIIVHRPSFQVDIDCPPPIENASCTPLPSCNEINCMALMVNKEVNIV